MSYEAIYNKYLIGINQLETQLRNQNVRTCLIALHESKTLSMYQKQLMLSLETEIRKPILNKTLIDELIEEIREAIHIPYHAHQIPQKE